MPFLIDGAVMLLLSIAVYWVVPDATQCNGGSSRDDSKDLDIRGILKVVRTTIITCFKLNVAKYIMIFVLHSSRQV